MISSTLHTLYHSIYFALRSLYCILEFLHTVLPFGLDIGLLGVAAYHITKLKKPDPKNVENIFGPDPRDKENQQKNSEKLIKCIAHRGAGLDAPENTLEAFRYCVERECNFIEMDVRSCKDGKLVLLHDQGLERLTGSDITDVHVMDWDKIQNIDVGVTHPNRQNFSEVHLCLLDEALDYLLENNVRMILDVKGEDPEVINGILKVFRERPGMYKQAAITCFNPFVLYQIRKKDPKIVGAISYRPYCFSSANYDAENGPTNPRCGDNIALHALLRACDALHSLMWRYSARWCNVSCVLVHKDMVSLSEVNYWSSLGVRLAGWCVNRPLEKLYWRGVLKAPYLSNTLMGEPEIENCEERVEKVKDVNNPRYIVDLLLNKKDSVVQFRNIKQ